MKQTIKPPSYTLAPDEKAAPVLAYTHDMLYRGIVVVKIAARVSNLLRMSTAPNRLVLYDTTAMHTGLANPPLPARYKRLSLATSQILAFYLLPPNQDPLDYDPAEQNRRTESVSITVGNLRIYGQIRLTGQMTMVQMLESAHDPFLSVYEAEVTSPLVRGMGNHKVPFVLVRVTNAVFGEAA
jgi:hypothetical protein